MSYKVESDKLSVEQSLQIITDVIEEAKSRFEENGIIYIFWGILIPTACLSQFVLLKNEYYDIHLYPYFLMPVGAALTFFYFSKKQKPKSNLIFKINLYIWSMLSINMLLLSFLFGSILQNHLIPIILLLMSIGLLISGISIKSKLLILPAIFVNLSNFIAFYLSYSHQLLLISVVAIVAFFIPGVILLIYDKRKKCSKI